jgi:GT2 family glycosyltransferase
MYDILIVNYNSANDVLDICNKLTNSNGSIYIWNNSPLDKLIGCKAHVYSNGSNIGFGRAVNELVQKTSRDWFFVVNPDMDICLNDLDELYECARCLSDDFVLISPNLLDEFGNNHSLGYFPIVFSPIKYLFKKPRILTHETYVTGALMLIRATAFNEIGGFCEDYFLYYEEVDLQRRFLEKGSRIFLHHLQVVHNHGGSSSNLINRLIHSDHSLRIYLKKYVYFWRFALLIAIMQRFIYVIKGRLGLREYLKYLCSF